jgi:hypothetical protein
MVATAIVSGRGGVDERGGTSCCWDRRRSGNQLGEFAEVLGGGGEVELVASTIWPA